MERAHGGYASAQECQRCHKVTMEITRVALEQVALTGSAHGGTLGAWTLCQQCGDELATQTRGWVGG